MQLHEVPDDGESKAHAGMTARGAAVGLTEAVDDAAETPDDIDTRVAHDNLASAARRAVVSERRRSA